MRTRRLKIPTESGEAVYHCITRTVNGEMLIHDTAKEILRKQLWQISDYCGVQVLTYVILDNHFHVMIRVPRKNTPVDQELLRRYRVLYPTPTKYQSARIEVIKSQLATNGPEALLWRKRQLALMGDVSQFMKLVKQRFSVWFNRTHKRYGTLWAERFKSLIVEPKGNAIAAVAAYIDLNCVRAGIVQDPKDYRFCGYAEAVACSSRACSGLVFVTGQKNWRHGQAAYRQWLFGAGSDPRENAAMIDSAALQKVVDAGGELPLSTVLRCRVRYFTDGVVLGSKAFVSQHLAAYQRASLRKRVITAPSPLPAGQNLDSNLATLRRLRRRAKA